MQRFILPRMASRACPLPLPRSGGCRRCKGEKSFRWKQHDGRNDGELLLPYGVRIYPRLLPPPAHPPPSPPFLSSKRLGLFPSNKVRPGKKEADADPLTRNGHIPVFVPSVARFSILSTLTLLVRPCSPIQRGFFRGTREPNAV